MKRKIQTYLQLPSHDSPPRHVPKGPKPNSERNFENRKRTCRASTTPNGK